MNSFDISLLVLLTVCGMLCTFQRYTLIFIRVTERPRIRRFRFSTQMPIELFIWTVVVILNDHKSIGFRSEER